MHSTKVTIGSDPELILTNVDGKVVCAGDLIDDGRSQFGVDGHRYTAELRPKAAIHPKDLTNSIRETLASRASQLQKYIWRSGPYVCDKPLGGHIHFGVPYEDHFKDALDHQLGVLLALVEPQDQAEKRRTLVFNNNNNGRPYGQLGDIRKKEWGFEYRTPGSFIVSPGITTGLLAVAKAIIWEELQGGSQAYSKLSESERKSLDFAKEDFYHCKKDVFKSKLDIIERQLFKMLYFNKDQEGFDLWKNVSYLLKQVVEKDGYNSKVDLKKKWKLLLEDLPKIKSPANPLWRQMVQDHNGWWFENPRNEDQLQFRIRPEAAQGAPPVVAPEPRQWRWAVIEPENLWRNLAG